MEVKGARLNQVDHAHEWKDGTQGVASLIRNRLQCNSPWYRIEILGKGFS